MAQRISRAKQTIKESDIPFRMPVREERHRRLRAVLHVIYLIFNEGYTASEGEQLQRADLAAEAIRLARVVYTKLPEDAEIAGLLALMLLTDARRAGRIGPQNEVIPLDRQDRSLWNRAADCGRRRTDQRGADTRSGGSVSAAGRHRRSPR